MSNSSRNVTFDIARALCMLWIVGFWHLAYYCSIPKNPYGIGLYVTNTVLACFCFISGFFIGKKDISPKIFYIARLRRFYLLFLIACLSLFVLGWFDNTKHFLFSITGLSCFFGPQPKTIWFFCMMIVFYIMTPFLLVANRIHCCIRIFLSVAMFFLINVFHPIDLRLPVYFIFYALGLLFPFSLMESLLKRNKVILPCCAVVYMAFFFVKHYYLVQFMAMLVGVLLIICISNTINALKITMLGRLFGYLSYCSMCAYLFHRQVYILSQYLLKDTFSCVTALFILCFVLLLGGGIQRFYDWGLKKINFFVRCK